MGIGVPKTGTFIEMFSDAKKIVLDIVTKHLFLPQDFFLGIILYFLPVRKNVSLQGKKI